MADFVETIKKDAVETGKMFHLFCEGLAKLLLTTKIVEFANEICENLIGQLGTDQVFKTLKF